MSTGAARSEQERLEQWVLEALASVGRGSDLDVARHVWTQHEDDLRAGGDLLFRWQLGLQDATAVLAATGRLTRAGGDWLLAGSAAAPPARAAWESDELAVVAEAYVAMLRDDHQGRPVRRAEVVADVVARTGRTEQALERIWFNVTHVVAELGYQPLGYWPPRSNVPAGVRPAVRAALGLPAEG